MIDFCIKPLFDRTSSGFTLLEMRINMWFYWLPVYFYMGLVFYLSSLGPSLTPSFILINDKVSHFLEFALLGFLLIRALNKSYSKNNFITLKLIAATIAIFYGATDEFHQRFVSGRNADFFDWLVDSLGAFCGSFIILKKESRWLR